MREINFYKTESGKCPVEEFLDSLSSKQAQKVTWVLRLIAPKSDDFDYSDEKINLLDLFLVLWKYFSIKIINFTKKGVVQ